MGMFDSVFVDCPKCGTVTEFQSKEGDCVFHSYSLSDDIPKEIIDDLVDYSEYCENENCRALLTIRRVIAPSLRVEAT